MFSVPCDINKNGVYRKFDQRVLTGIGILCVLYSNGQTDYSSYEDKIASQKRKILWAPFVIDAEIIKSEAYRPEHGGMIYTYHILNVSKVFRGDSILKIGTAVMIREGGESPTPIKKTDEYTWTLYAPCFEFCVGNGMKGVFLCEVADSSSFGMFPETDNLIHLKPVGWYQYNKPDFEYAVRGQGNNFKTMEEFYEFLRKQPNIAIPKEDENK